MGRNGTNIIACIFLRDQAYLQISEMSEEKGRLDAGEACNPEMPIRINKKKSPRKMCSPSQRNRKGTAETDC